MNDIALLFQTEEDRIEASVALKLLGKTINKSSLFTIEEYVGAIHYCASKNVWLFTKNSSNFSRCNNETIKLAENLVEFLESISG